MKNKILFPIVILIFQFVKTVDAVPAYPYYFEYKQPNGTILTMKLMGDEKIHWAETTDHYSLMSDGKNGWVYAMLDEKGDMVPSRILAADPGKRADDVDRFLSLIPKSIRYSKEQSSILVSLWNESKSNKAFVPNGNKNLVMILVAFTDKAFTRTQAEFNNLMNQVGYNLNGAQGSVKDFFLENSYGAFNITTTVVGPYTLSKNMVNYGGNDASGNDLRPRDMVTEAVNLANPAVNYANFDNDGDGTVDGVYVVYAGYGEEAGAGANCIWAHAWNIPTVNLDGVNISKYSCSSELRGTSGTNITTIGVICHEFGHVCGAPDYYDVDYATNGQYDGTGNWDLMAGGSWNGINAAGDCPAHVNGYQKWQYGWAHPLLLNVAQAVTLNNSAQNDDFCYFQTTTANEFYYCENRQKVGFDRGIPGHGMIIYHVDQPYIAGAGGSINAGSHQGMYPVCANAAGNPTAVYGTINGGGCPFPGTGAKTSFTDATTPNAKSWAGANTGKPLTNIAEAGTDINFCYISCAAGDPINLTATAVSSSQINLTWQLNSNNDPVVVCVSPDAAFGTPVNGTAYVAGNSIPGGDLVIYKGTATSFNHTGLNPNTRYYYKAWSVLTGTTYSTGTTADATTFCGSVTSYPYTQGFENGGVIPVCRSQQVVTGGINWVFRAGSGSGTPAAAHGGSYNANFYEGAYGTVNCSKLVSPSFNLTALNSPKLTFWLYNALWPSDQDVLKVYYKTSAAGAWTLLNTYNTNVSTWTLTSINLPNKSNDYYIAFEATENYGYGVCIDDITVLDNSALPVELVNSEAECNEGEAIIKWSTASETQTSSFRVDKSTDLVNYNHVTNVSAAGNSNELRTYRVVDKRAIGNSYYRLTEIDLNGEETILSVIYADCNGEKSLVRIYPNPATDMVKVDGVSENSIYSIFDLSGRVVKKSTLDKGLLDLKGLDQGLYYLSIGNEKILLIKK